MQSPFTFDYTAPDQTEGKQPALFLLHGMGSDEKDLLQLAGACKGSHHIFSLRGPIVQPPGYAFFTMEEEGKPDREIFDKIVLYIQSFIREAIGEYDLDEKRLTVAGFSQGAVLAQTLGLTMIPALHSIAALSGYLPTFVKDEYAKQPADQLRVFISHGDYDYVIPPQWGADSKDYFEAAGADVTFKTYREGHGVPLENQHDLTQFLKSL